MLVSTKPVPRKRKAIDITDNNTKDGVKKKHVSAVKKVSNSSKSTRPITVEKIPPLVNTPEIQQLNDFLVKFNELLHENCNEDRNKMLSSYSFTNSKDEKDFIILCYVIDRFDICMEALKDILKVASISKTDIKDSIASIPYIYATNFDKLKTLIDIYGTSIVSDNKDKEEILQEILKESKFNDFMYFVDNGIFKITGKKHVLYKKIYNQCNLDKNIEFLRYLHSKFTLTKDEVCSPHSRNLAGTAVVKHQFKVTNFLIRELRFRLRKDRPNDGVIVNEYYKYDLVNHDGLRVISEFPEICTAILNYQTSDIKFKNAKYIFENLIDFVCLLKKTDFIKINIQDIKKAVFSRKVSWNQAYTNCLCKDGNLETIKLIVEILRLDWHHFLYNFPSESVEFKSAPLYEICKNDDNLNILKYLHGKLDQVAISVEKESVDECIMDCCLSKRFEFAKSLLDCFCVSAELIKKYMVAVSLERNEQGTDFLKYVICSYNINPNIFISSIEPSQITKNILNYHTNLFIDIIESFYFDFVGVNILTKFIIRNFYKIKDPKILGALLHKSSITVKDRRKVFKESLRIVINENNDLSLFLKILEIIDQPLIDIVKDDIQSFIRIIMVAQKFDFFFYFYDNGILKECNFDMSRLFDTKSINPTESSIIAKHSFMKRIYKDEKFKDVYNSLDKEGNHLSDMLVFLRNDQMDLFNWYFNVIDCSNLISEEEGIKEICRVLHESINIFSSKGDILKLTEFLKNLETNQKDLYEIYKARSHEFTNKKSSAVPDEQKSGTTCMICYTKEVNAISKPCMHATFCSDCASVTLATKPSCPVCRANLESYDTFFISGVN